MKPHNNIWRTKVLNSVTQKIDNLLANQSLYLSDTVARKIDNVANTRDQEVFLNHADYLSLLNYVVMWIYQHSLDHFILGKHQFLVGPQTVYAVARGYMPPFKIEYT